MAIKFNPIHGTLLVVIATILLYFSDAQDCPKKVTFGGWKSITNLTGGGNRKICNG
ncbi:hypothetical protein P3S68_013605 [Capsicum galapagoense]